MKVWGVRDHSWATVDEGLCFGDIDGDGAPDIVACGGVEGRKSVTVYRNDLAPQNWLNVRVLGRAGNFAAAGSKIRLYAPGTSRLIGSDQIVNAGRQTAHTYYTFGATERHFGLGSITKVEVEVEYYPSRTKVIRRNVTSNHTIELSEDAAK